MKGCEVVLQKFIAGKVAETAAFMDSTGDTIIEEPKEKKSAPIKKVGEPGPSHAGPSRAGSSRPQIQKAPVRKSPRKAAPLTKKTVESEGDSDEDAPQRKSTRRPVRAASKSAKYVPEEDSEDEEEEGKKAEDEGDEEDDNDDDNDEEDDDGDDDAEDPSWDPSMDGLSESDIRREKLIKEWEARKDELDKEAKEIAESPSNNIQITARKEFLERLFALPDELIAGKSYGEFFKQIRIANNLLNNYKK